MFPNPKTKPGRRSAQLISNVIIISLLSALFRDYQVITTKIK